jgi:hypothetical protein
MTGKDCSDKKKGEWRMKPSSAVLNRKIEHHQRNAHAVDDREHRANGSSALNFVAVQPGVGLQDHSTIFRFVTTHE